MTSQRGSGRTFVCGLAATVLFAQSVLANCTTAPSNVVAWWPFDQNLSEIVGQAPTTPQGSPTFITGKVNSALLLDGTDSVSVPSSTALNVGLQSGFTVEGWIRPSSVAFQQPVVEWNNGSGGIGVHLWISVGAGAGSLFGNLIDTNGLSHQIFTAAGVVGTAQFQHVALTYDRASGTTMFFVNGNPVSQTNLGSFTPDTRGNVYLGLRPSGTAGGNRFSGALDEISIYNRSLTSNEVNSIYLAGAAGKCPVSISAPSIVTQPADQSVYEGGSATFSVVAVGTEPLFYQWRLGGTLITNETSSSLILTNVQGVGTRTYSVIVSNSAGSVESSNAVLTVLPVSGCSPPANLVAWWPFDQSLSEVVGSAPTTPQGTPPFITGKVNSALFLDGTDSVSTPASPALNVGLQNGFTVEGWIRPSTVALQQPLVEWNDAAGKIGVHFWISAGGGAGSLLANLIDSNGGSHQIFSAGGLIGTAQFQHVALTYDRLTGITALFVDGSPVSQSNLGSFTPDTHGNVYLGLRPSGVAAGNRFFGAMDEISIYNRALSSTEIYSVYASGSTGKCGVAVSPPLIISQPADQAILEGDSATFAVVALGSEPIFYQWRVGGDSITNETGSSLTLSNVQGVGTRLYSVIVSNAGGWVESSNAVLTVRPADSCNPATGLVAWWPFDEDLTDVFGAAPTTAQGNPTFVAGEVNSALLLDGTDSVSALASPALNVGLQNGFTVEGWIRPNTVAYQQPLLEWNNGAIGAHFWISVGGGPGSLFANLIDPSGASHQIFSSAGVIGTAQFQHVALTYDRSSGATALFVNGNPVAERDLGSFTPDTRGNLYFGLRPSGTAVGNRFSGALDEISIYNRALSKTEISSIYAAGIVGKCALPVSAPSIVTQPTDQSVLEGESATFTVVAVGHGPFSYQWRLNGDPLTNETSDSLTIVSAQISDTGIYSVDVSNDVGSISSSNATLTVTKAPDFDLSKDFSKSSNPTGVWTYGYKEALTGTIVPFALFRQQYDQGGALEDVWSRTYGISSAVFHNGSILTGRSDDGAGTFPPRNVMFFPGLEGNVDNYGVIRFTAPQSGIYQLGSSVQSYLDGPISGDTDFHVLANDAELFGQFLPGNAGATYSDELFLAAGDSLDFVVGRGQDNHLNASGLKINVALNLVSTNDSAPIIEKQPVNTTVLLGSTATLSVVAGGTAPLSYQWLKGDQELDGATGPQLILPNAAPENEGSYSVRVSNALGTNVSNTLTLTVNVIPVAPFITTLSQGLTAPVGSNITLSVVAGGTAPLSYQWRLNDIDIPDAHDSSLSLPNAQVTNSGVYRVFISNTAGDKLSDPINVTVIVPPVLAVITAQPADQSVSLGQDASFSVTATGELLSYQWRFNNTDIPNATSASLSITNAQEANAGDYSVVVSNPAGPVPSDTAHLTVHIDRTLSLQNPPDAHEGDLISVPLLLVSTGDVGGLSFRINFNPDVLSAPEIIWDSSLDTALKENNATAGLLQGIFVLPATAVPAGTQQLATIHFRARTVPADSASLLNLQVTDLSDSAGDPILYGTKIAFAIAHVLASGSDGLAGDNNGNGQIDVGDASLLLRLLAHLDSTRPFDVIRNDFNHNSVLDSGDAIKILRIVAGIDAPPQLPLSVTTSKKSSGSSSSTALSVAESLTLEPDHLQASAGQLITLRVKIANLAGPISGAKFTVNYPTQALRLRNQQDLRVGPSVSPQALAVWNVTPSQNNFLTQNGHATLALSSANSWTLGNPVLAELTFEVQSGAAAQYLWSLTVTGGEVTTDGYSPRSLADGQTNFIGRDQLAATFGNLVRQPSGQFQFTLSGDPGAGYIVEASDDLVSWSLVTSVSNSPASIPVTDAQASGHPQRFYRARPTQ